MEDKDKDKDYPNWIYIGPTLARLGLKKSSLVLGSVPPPQLQSLIDLKPIVGSLFVPTYRAQTAIIRSRVAGSLEHIASQEVFKFGQEMKDRERKVNKEIRRF